MISLNKIRNLVEKSVLYIASCDRKCSPHVIAVACAKVIGPKTLLVTDNYMKTTRKNMLSNSNVEILAYDKKWKGVRIKGKSCYYNSGKWLDAVRQMKENKPHPAKGAIVITASKIEKLE